MPTSSTNEDRPQRTEKKMPVFTYDVPIQGGKLNLAVWETSYGEGEKGKVSSSVTFQRTYYDAKKKVWGETAFIRQSDIPALVLALQQVYFRLLDQKQP